MNKQEAADFLGVSVRALERYVQQGRISVKYEKGKTRSVANFDATELEAFRTELNEPSYKPAVETRQTATKDESRQMSPDNQSKTNKDLLHSGEIATFGEVDQFSVIDKLSIIIERLLLLSQSQNQPTLAIADKLLLKLPEAQALTGLSKEFLRTTIKQGTLKAEKIGCSWRIKRSDLEGYIASLF